ncbi:hypothetical protein QFC20_005648 [Naganishia adeliensis]|uniref:Uncharacterized protein n=1 Tax=Naganishia adeliensis TaxID=92952 RepID=A0ACC2VL03_9TREE|nr:hypothetical protein QFC20_005648 [Naganishia adeliensis]
MLSRVRQPVVARQILVSDIVEIDDLRKLARLVPKGPRQQEFFQPNWNDSVMSDSLKEALEPLQKELAATMPASVKSICSDTLAKAFDSHTADDLTYQKMVTVRDHLFAGLAKEAEYQEKKRRCTEGIQKSIDNINQTHPVHISVTGKPLTSRCMGFYREGQKIVIWQWLVNLKIKSGETAGKKTELSLSICSAVTLEDQVSRAVGEDNSDQSLGFGSERDIAATGLTRDYTGIEGLPTSISLSAPKTQRSFHAIPSDLDGSRSLLNLNSSLNRFKARNIELQHPFRDQSIHSGEGDNTVAKALGSWPPGYSAGRRLRRVRVSPGGNDEGNLNALGKTSRTKSLADDETDVLEDGSASSSLMPTKNVRNGDPYYPQPNSYLDGLPSAKSYKDLCWGREWSQYTSAFGRPEMEDFVSSMSTRHELGRLSNRPLPRPSG